MINIKKNKSKNVLKKGSIKIKTKKCLILRIHDIIQPLPNFIAHPANLPSVPSIYELDQLLSGIHQTLKKKLHFVQLSS